jgi:glycosyltransferase involved in cell wall biosynthesis
MPPETHPCAATAARLAPVSPRVAVLAESLPWPTLKGGDLRTWQNVHALSGCSEVGVFGLCSNDRRRHAQPDLPLAFWTASSDPALASPPPQGVRIAARAWLLDPSGHPSDLFHSPGAADELRRKLAVFRPDVVLVEGVWLHGYLDVVRETGADVVLDCFNVEASLFRELASCSTGTGFEARILRDVLPARTEAIERRAVTVADALWTCSDEDARQLHALYSPRAPVAVIPNGVRVDTAPSPHRGRPSDGAVRTLVFPGIYSYPPNAAAASFLIDELVPRLAEACDIPFRMQLVGPMPTPAMLAAAERDSRIEVTGPVRDVRTFLDEASVMPVPLVHGSGTRLKVLEAFAAGLPVVSTPKGVEGLAVEGERHLRIARTPDEFVESILALWEDTALAERLTAAARALVIERYSWDAIAPKIRTEIGSLSRARADR